MNEIKGMIYEMERGIVTKIICGDYVYVLGKEKIKNKKSTVDDDFDI